MLYEHLLVFHDSVAVILLEFLLPAPTDSFHELGLDDANDVLERRFRTEGKFELRLHFIDEDIRIIFNFCFIAVSSLILMLFSHVLVCFINLFVGLAVATSIDHFAVLETDAVINQIKKFKVLKIEVLHIQDFVDLSLIFLFLTLKRKLFMASLNLGCDMAFSYFSS